MNENKALTPERLGEIRSLIKAVPFPMAEELLAAHDSLAAQLADLQRKNGYYMSAVDVCEDFKKLHPLLDGFECKGYYPDNVAEFIKHLKTQLAEARAEAEGFRHWLKIIANGDPMAGLDLRQCARNALSTPPSHFAKKYELMGAVVDAASNFVNGGVVHAASCFRDLEEALEAYMTNEQAGGAG